MGEYAEMALEYEMNMALNGPHYEVPEPDYGIWTMRDHTKIRVSDMGSAHLSNTIAMLRRGSYQYKQGYIDSMEAELKRRAKR